MRLSPLIPLTALALAGGAGAQTLTNTTWTLTDLTEGGRPATPGSAAQRPTLRLDARAASGSTGCNSYRAAYASRGDVLRFTRLATTRRACPDRQDALEARFVHLMGQVNHYRLGGTTLTLFAGSRDRLVFRAGGAATPGTASTGEASTAEANVNLDGTWTLTGGTALRPSSGGEVGSVPSLTLAGGRVSGTGGCNRLMGTFRLQGESLTFGPLATTRMLCAPAVNTQEQTFLAFLGQPLTARVQRQTLTLRDAAGKTLVFSRAGTASGTPQGGGQTQVGNVEGSYTLASVSGQAAPRTTQPVTLRLEGNRISGSDGCNNLSGGYRLEQGRLVLTGGLASTLRACPDQTEQVPLAQVLNARPTLTVTPSGLTLTANGTTLTFTRDRAGQGATQGRVQTWTVAPQRVPCTGVAPISCLRVQKDGGPWELFYGEIEGFTFRPGVTQVIRVREEERPGPVLADASSKRYVLVEVIERR